MSPVAALRLPEQIDLRGFIRLLQQAQVPHRVAEEAGEQVLWVPGEAIAEQVRELYARFPQGHDGLIETPLAPPAVSAPGFIQQLRNSPLSAALLAHCAWPSTRARSKAGSSDALRASRACRSSQSTSPR